MKRQYILFIVLLIAYLTFININLNYVLGYDESRHAVQGHFFYDYFRTLLSGRFVGVSQFLEEYSHTGYNIGWSALFDPPAHAIVQGLLFFINDSYIFARLATEVFVVGGAVIFYLLCLKVFEKKWLAIPTVFLYLMMPYVFTYSRESMLMVPISMLMVGWYYFTFHNNTKWSWVVAGLFLAGATLMKYNNIIYAGAFVAAYALIIMAVRKDWKDGHAWATALKSLVAAVIVFVLGAWWLKLQYDTGMLQRVWYEGAIRSEGVDRLFYVKSLFTLTYGFILLILVPLARLKRPGSWIQKNWRLGLFALTTTLIASSLITNLKIRYMIAAVPFFFIFIVQGAYELGNHIRLQTHLVALVLLLGALLVFSVKDAGIVVARPQDYGRYNTELIDTLSAIPDPKLLSYIKGGGARSVNYYDTPDYFAFQAMTFKNGFDPLKAAQFVDIQFWEGNLEYKYAEYLAFLNNTATTIPVIITLFRHEPNCTLYRTFGPLLEQSGFSTLNITYYTLYAKWPQTG